MNKKILSVSQRMQKERLCGVIYLIGGLIFSCKGIEKNLILVACFAAVMIMYTIFTIIQDRNYEIEKFDEMATENLNKASRKVLRYSFCCYFGCLYDSGFIKIFSFSRTSMDKLFFNESTCICTAHNGISIFDDGYSF